MALKFDIFYRRPTPGLEKGHLSSGSDDGHSSQPPQLSFDKIIAGDTRSPCGLRDFMRYCLFVEHSAENLQFYLWLRDYTIRFHETPKPERDLSPEWTAEDQTRALRRACADSRTATKTLSVSTSLPQRADAESITPSVASLAETDNPFSTPPDTPGIPQDMATPSVPLSGIRVKSMRSVTGSIMTGASKEESLYSGLSAASIASESFMSAGLSKPFTVQPFRREIDQVTAMYLANGADREINLADTEKKAVLMALRKTTHPSAFNSLEGAVKHSLLLQSHPNFIRWAICNCSPPRQIFCYSLAIILILCGIIVSLLFTLSDLTREWRALGAIFEIIGVAYLIITAKGVCPVLYGLQRRHVRPWEPILEGDHDPMDEAFAPLGDLDLDGGRNGDWAAWYGKRSLIRKIFDREVWVQEPALRWIHHQIALQATALALPVTGVFLAIFLTVPDGHIF